MRGTPELATILSRATHERLCNTNEKTWSRSSVLESRIDRFYNSVQPLLFERRLLLLDERPILFYSTGTIHWVVLVLFTTIIIVIIFLWVHLGSSAS